MFALIGLTSQALKSSFQNCLEWSVQLNYISSKRFPSIHLHFTLTYT